MFLGLNLQNAGFVGAVSSPPPLVLTGTPFSVTFSRTGGYVPQPWTVPAGTYSVTGRLWGGGGFSLDDSICALGHYCAMGFNVSPGNVISVYVGSPNDTQPTTISHTGILLYAGGGGGTAKAASPPDFEFFALFGTAGGNGGVTGQQGNGAGGGFGGGSGAGGGRSTPNGNNGVFITGGAGGVAFDLDGTIVSAGVGGAGYYGGGGGGAVDSQTVGGGGGGSSFASGGYNIAIAGNGANWNSDPYWNHSGAMPNAYGYVVFTYVTGG